MDRLTQMCILKKPPLIKSNPMIKISLSILLFLATLISTGQEIVEPKFLPKLGVCTSINNHEIVAAAGFDYIEESVGRFLVPSQPEENFQKNLSIFKESSIPILACNSFLPGSLKTTGPEPRHEEILAFSEIALFFKFITSIPCFSLKPSKSI